MLNRIFETIMSLITIGIAIIVFGIIFQIIFGGEVPLIKMDIIGTVSVIISDLGLSGLALVLPFIALYFASSRSKK